MKVETEIEVTLSKAETQMLWAIMHHHINQTQLDVGEQKFRHDFLLAVDPDKEYEAKYPAMPKTR